MFHGKEIIISGNDTQVYDRGTTFYRDRTYGTGTNITGTIETGKKVVFHALDSLEITYGASHTELKIAKDGTIALIEIGGRMGGDFIGSNLVQLSTGIDFVKAVIDISLGEEPDLAVGDHAAAGVRFVFDQKDVDILENSKRTS